MVTLNQLIKKKRKKKRVFCKTPALGGKPQRKAVCHWAFFMDPKKPNSANRHVARAGVLGTKYLRIAAFIPGGLHTVQRFSRVLLMGGKVRDLPGVNYKVVRGKYDCARTRDRKRKRSKYSNVRKRKIKVIIMEFNMKRRRRPRHNERHINKYYY